MFILFFFSQTQCKIGDNIMKNPSFEDGFTDYKNNRNECQISSTFAKTGSNSLYCKGTKGSVYQHLYNITEGLNYEVSAYIRMNQCSGRVLISFESKDYSSGVYAYSTSNNNCKNNDCYDNWYKISGKSLSPFKESEKYTVGITVRDSGECEFYLDDIEIKPIVNENLLRSVEIQAWRHEVYKEKVKVFVDLLIKDTLWEKGDYMNIFVDIIDEETNATQYRLTEWKIVKREENYVAQFELDSSKLNPGYYNVKATVINLLADISETASTSIHVLDKNRKHSIYIDKHLRVIDHGKPFFPLGLMCGDCKLEYFSKYFVDSPFNLVEIASKHNYNDITKFYKEGNYQLRIIDRGIQKFLNYDLSNETEANKIQSQLSDYIKEIKDNPGLFGYYSSNESPVSEIPKLKAHTRIIREIDYDHPLWGVFNLRLYMHEYKECVDCYGTDIYPGIQFEPLHYVYIVTREGRDRVVNNLANWGVPQFFDWTIEGKENERPVDKNQMYQTMYQMLVGGANGIIWFDFHEMTKSPVDWKPYWEDLKDIVKSFKEKYVPIFLSANEPDPEYDKSRIWEDENNKGRPCGLRFFRFNKADYILAVNPKRDEDKKCIFDVPKSAKNFKILEGNSKMEKNGTTIILDMPKMDVTWLRAKNEDYPFDEELYEKGYFDDESNSKTGVIVCVVIVIILIIIIAVFSLIIIFKRKGILTKKEISSSNEI